jgi:hypothetical protein
MAPLKRCRTDLRGVVGSSATAYGYTLTVCYTLTVWSTGTILMGAYGPPSPPRVFTFLAGAVVAFVVVGVLAYGGVTAEFGGGSNRVELWGGFHFLSVGLAVAAAWLVSAYAPALTGWPLAAFVATGAYLFIVGLEQTAADREG